MEHTLRTCVKEDGILFRIGVKLCVFFVPPFNGSIPSQIATATALQLTPPALNIERLQHSIGALRDYERAEAGRGLNATRFEGTCFNKDGVRGVKVFLRQKKQNKTSTAARPTAQLSAQPSTVSHT